MPNRGRTKRGRETQALAATWFQAHGWPWAYSKGSGESGIDVENMPGLSPEVKGTRGDNCDALRQAHRNRGTGIPFVVWRPDGYGPERIAEWPVFFRLEDATALLRAAGYGDPEETQP
jgi:hypothetical protein